VTQHRKGLFRHGNRWCSAAELERLRRDAAEDGPEAQKRLRRAQVRCGKFEIKLGYNSTPDDPLKQLALTVSRTIQKHYIDAGGERYWTVHFYVSEPYTYFEIFSLRYDEEEAKALITALRKALKGRWTLNTYPWYGEAQSTAEGVFLVLSASGPSAKFALKGRP